MDTERSLDPLTDILRHVRVDGALISRAQGHCPWGVHTRGASAGMFHVILRGEGVIRVFAPGTLGPALSSTRFRAGDVLVLPHGHPHALASSETAGTTWLRELPRSDDTLPVVSAGVGEGPPDTDILCGTLSLAGEADHLLPQLPPLLRAAGGVTARWLEASVEQLAAEVERGEPGTGVVVSRLAELLFVQAVRTWVTSPVEPPPGWLTALGDPPLARALALLHGSPERSWSVDHLARRAGMSRTGFYARFSATVGEPPAAYLTRWRMTLARRALRDTAEPIPAIAGRLGYASEAAFNRAFKRVVGEPPGAWRRGAPGGGVSRAGAREGS